MKRAIVILAGVMALSVCAMAQDRGVEVYGGYSYARLNPGGLDSEGWNAALTGKITKHFGITGDLGGLYGSRGGVDEKVHTYMIGPQFRATTRKFTPFVHALFGGAHANAGAFGVTATDNSFAMALGGGLDLGSGRFAVRLIQADYLMTRFGGDHQNHARLGAGIVFRFGK